MSVAAGLVLDEHSKQLARWVDPMGMGLTAYGIEIYRTYSELVRDVNAVVFGKNPNNPSPQEWIRIQHTAVKVSAVALAIVEATLRKEKQQ